MSYIEIVLLVGILLAKPVSDLVGSRKTHQILPFFEKNIPLMYESSVIFLGLMSRKGFTSLVYVCFIGIGIMQFIFFLSHQSAWDVLIAGMMLIGTGSCFLYKNERHRQCGKADLSEF